MVMITYWLKIGGTLQINRNNNYKPRSHNINVYFFRFFLTILNIHNSDAILNNVQFHEEGNPIVKQNKMTQARIMEYAKDKTSIVFFNI